MNVVCGSWRRLGLGGQENKMDIYVRKFSIWGEGENMRDLVKSIDYLLIFVSEWTSGDWCAHACVCVCLCVCVHVCVCV